MKQVQGHWRAREAVVEKLRHIESNQRAPRQSRHHFIPSVVEHPSIVAPARIAPAGKPRMQSFWISTIEEFHQARESPRFRFETQCAPQRLIEISRFPHRI